MASRKQNADPQLELWKIVHSDMKEGFSRIERVTTAHEDRIRAIEMGQAEFKGAAQQAAKTSGRTWGILTGVPSTIVSLILGWLKLRHHS